MSDWNLDNALRLNFYQIVTSQLRPVWHRLHARTKQVAADLHTLRTMLFYLLSFDAVKFNQYLDTVLAASQPKSTFAKMFQSPWLLLDAAQTIFERARLRVYAGKLTASSGSASINSKSEQETIRPVLEELPKWAVLSEALDEIERDVYFNPVHDDSSGAILIMCGDHGTCSQLREYLQTRQMEKEKIDEQEAEEPYFTASFMMKRKLRKYIRWKREFSQMSATLQAESQNKLDTKNENSGARGRAPPNKRRRVRGSASVASGLTRADSGRTAGDKDAHLSSLLDEVQVTDGDEVMKEEIGADPLNDMEDYYELYEMNDLIIVHPYDDDIDEHVLEEVRPRYIIMYEPESAFIRRVEIYRSSHTDRNVRVYFMYYKDSVEEQMYLAQVRREKDAFTKLIRERGVSLTIADRSAEGLQSFSAWLSPSIA